ncbi:cephalosporin-C deacetylase-like acetyl esterase [Algoriphagus boseongensis]|uniref:Cephalosporin-C deacetylase-like acetyl esterase n=1 Tax=Algoriphagus boseongensis TaxID=1442587 RepID=A0A4R6T2Q7_9BACT|nr:acetylxylan esterase [Algoriphagus boseongensis]TDQ16236.1 cephalosporin-C deacetylase-like acetyl esterase [Algoriphagus boseongensis]
MTNSHFQASKKFLYGIVFLFFILLSPEGFSQIAKQYLDISVSPSKVDWNYSLGEKVEFIVSVTQSGRPVPVENVRYFVKEEKMDPLQEGPLELKNGMATISAPGMKTPGFLRCEVFATIDGKEYRGLGTAAFEAEKIQPTVAMPADFEAFWNAGKEELAKIPMDPKMIHILERSTETVDVYHVNFQNVKNSRIYGVLTVPKGAGKFPAILQVPGAGIRPYTGDLAKAARGAIVLQIGIHGIPIDMAPEVYSNLASGALNGYWNFNVQDKDIYYYKRVYLGCIRAVDFLVSLPQYDGENLAVQGGSQGGALSIITAALDSRIKYLVSYYPALSDMTGYLNGRAGGWPHIFSPANQQYYATPKGIETISYYDVVNFARILKTPGFYSWGYNDDTCPPTSFYSAYNQIKAPKEVFVIPETGHWTYPEQGIKADNWLFEKLKK